MREFDVSLLRPRRGLPHLETPAGGLPGLADRATRHPAYVIKLKSEIKYRQAGYLTYLGSPSPCKQAITPPSFKNLRNICKEYFFVQRNLKKKENEYRINARDLLA